VSDFYSYDPARKHGLRHDPVSAIVAPRPIGWISTLSRTGVRNLAPYSFFNLFNYRPPVLAFSSVGRKDTVVNAESSGEFVWNLATEAWGPQMNATSAAVPPEIDEFEMVGLAALDSDVVRPPRVAQSPASFECLVSDVLRLRTAAGVDLDTWMVIGDVVRIHIDTAYLDDGRFDTAAANPLLRAGGPGSYYIPTDARSTFMVRPEPLTR
jgi:flavin reductase (DIM6/NTAB) family NADH-FMN oxidoreductase RutF